MKIPKGGDVGIDMWNRNGKHVKMYFAILGNIKIHKNSYKADILRKDGLIIKDCSFFPSDKLYCLLESC